MITCLLQGGLGNQMFQIAATSALAWRHDGVASFDLEKHHLPFQGRKAFNYVENIFRLVPFVDCPQPTDVYKEPHHHYAEIPYRKNMMLFGYFQSEKYFEDYQEEIRNLFSPDKTTKEYLLRKYGSELSGDVASIHVRRGDYLKLKDFHPTCTKKYYIDAIALLPEDTNYLIFSDDPTWCTDNFEIQRFTVIEGEEDYIDLYLMSMCKNNIIANSSFSWWAAWLNSNEEKVVVAPEIWFGPSGPKDVYDLIPNGWLRI